jgi:hypothetical protein
VASSKYPYSGLIVPKWLQVSATLVHDLRKRISHVGNRLGFSKKPACYTPILLKDELQFIHSATKRFWVNLARSSGLSRPLVLRFPGQSRKIFAS